MDERDWTDRPLAEGETLEAPGVSVTRVVPGVQTLVSGDLEAAIGVLAPGARMLGFADVPDSPDLVLRIARDRALLVTALPVPRTPGWQSEGFALSAAGGLYACLSLRGPGAEALLSQALTGPAPHGSPSAALRFAGTTALVTGLADGLSLWVEQGHLALVTGVLRQAGDTRPGQVTHPR